MGTPSWVNLAPIPAPLLDHARAAGPCRTVSK